MVCTPTRWDVLVFVSIEHLFAYDVETVELLEEGEAEGLRFGRVSEAYVSISTRKDGRPFEFTNWCVDLVMDGLLRCESCWPQAVDRPCFGVIISYVT